MGIRYYKLFDMLNRRGMKKTDLLCILSSKTIAKLSKGEYVSGEVIDKICDYLDCQPGDIMEHVNIMKDNLTNLEFEIANHTHALSQENEIYTEPVNIYPHNHTYTGPVHIANDKMTIHGFIGEFDDTDSSDID